MATGQPRTGMVALREANLWPTVKPQPGSKAPLGRAALLPIGLREQAAPVPQAGPAEQQPGVLHVAVEEAKAHLDRVADIAGPALAPPAAAVPRAWVEHEAAAVGAVVEGAGSSTDLNQTHSPRDEGYESNVKSKPRQAIPRDRTVGLHSSCLRYGRPVPDSER